ncbi:type VI secretion system baseplate subunit TssG [Rheinheimera maricola]|uniref:Type VI secretion system baseplate subunit TssG n=1 Tax=Rheinheimera maricola TaxID=2793282 RepID=A0ABS7XDK7_9GAMM|nr:type VI secretion system baseplate subunit TssG [Rheinheimera maricola]MBZ9613416.1 type VI secretion system baseplate subunit TssG [Rheinheimera maricola]
MEHASRKTRLVLTRKLVQEPKKYTFSKAAELIERDFENGISSLKSVNSEPFLFRANPSFAFPSSDIDDIYQLDDGRFEVVVNFMGLYGPASPLPDYFTQEVIDELVEVESVELSTFYIHSLSELKAYQEKRLDMLNVRKRLNQDTKDIGSNIVKKIVLSQQQITAIQKGETIDKVLTNLQYNELFEKKAYLQMHHRLSANQRDFLDVFNHRLIYLYLQATRKYHPYRTSNLTNDYNLNILYSLIGAPSEADRLESPVKWHKLLKFSGLLSLKQGSAEVIKKVIAGYFDVYLENVEVEECVFREISIPLDQVSYLGFANNGLGESFLCGQRIGDCQGKFRVHLFGLDDDTYFRFIPEKIGQLVDSHYYFELKALLEFLKSPEQIADVGLHLDNKSRLQFNLDPVSPTILGYSSWLNPSDTQSRHVVI